MSDAIDFAELDGQQWELLPARTVLSLFSAVGGDGAPGVPGAPGESVPGDNGDPGVPGDNGQGTAGNSLLFVFNYAFSRDPGISSGSGSGS